MTIDLSKKYTFFIRKLYNLYAVYVVELHFGSTSHKMYVFQSKMDGSYVRAISVEKDFKNSLKFIYLLKKPNLCFKLFTNEVCAVTISLLTRCYCLLIPCLHRFAIPMFRNFLRRCSFFICLS